MTKNAAVNESSKTGFDETDLERAKTIESSHEVVVEGMSAIADNDKNANARGTWGYKIEFIFTCIGFAVGLGNVWRFPYLCFKNGGGAFLIPYGLMLAITGLPLFFMEFAFGQFASLGPISIWNISPLFKGVGYAMTAVAWFISIYYNVIIAQAFFYLFASFNSKLPWSECGDYNTESIHCKVLGTNNTSPDSNYSISPAENYYNGYVLQKSAGFHEFGTPVWHLTLCLLLSWIIIFLILLKGIQSLGKVSYFTAIFPYIMLTALLINSAMLEGSMNGVLYYITPDFSKLKEPSAWTDAATQIFFSLSCCNGGLITMSSFNKFKNNCCRDAVLVACINCLTSIFAGFVVFSTLGFMAFKMGTSVESVVKEGPGLVFMVYPEAINQMPVPILWSILFFLMLVTLGLGSELPLVETIVSSAQDEFRKYNVFQTNKSKIIFRAAICSVNFLIALPMVCPGGIYMINLIDSVLSGYPLLFVCLFEIIVICYVYGLNQFLRDIKLMINTRPNWYWRICWLIITPLTTVSLIIFNFVSRKPISLGEYVYPDGMQVLGNLVSAFPICLIPAWFLFKFCREGGWLLLREFSKPVYEWGPAEVENRLQFLMQVYAKNQKENGATITLKDTVLELQPEDDDVAVEDDLAVDAPARDAIAANRLMINSTTSCLALCPLAQEGTDFFQSKLSVAEKLTHAYEKDVVKRGGTVGNIPNILASNETLAMSENGGLTTNQQLARRGRDESDVSITDYETDIDAQKLEGKPKKSRFLWKAKDEES